MRISDWSSDVCSSDLDKESGKIATGAKALDIAMEEDGARTYGEFLAGRKTKRVRMPLGGEGYDFYPERRHLEHEFDCFWAAQAQHHAALLIDAARDRLRRIIFFQRPLKAPKVGGCTRSEEHTSELQSLMRISYAVFCLKKKKTNI